MNRFVFVALSLLAFGATGELALAQGAGQSAQTTAQGGCQAKAVGKDGKPLSGAALKSFMTKCEKDMKGGCEAKAVDKNGKALAGAARTSFLKKCEQG